MLKLLITAASLVAEHGLAFCGVCVGLVALWHMRSSCTWDWFHLLH